jgi:hypothetical protein
LHPWARPPWHLPAPNALDTVVTCARPDAVWSVEGGAFHRTALARIADAHASWCCRLTPPTPLLAAVADRLVPGALAPVQTTGASALVPHPIWMDGTAPVASRRRAARVPAAVVQARRSMARKHAQHHGAPPSHAPLAVWAWPLVRTKVPQTLWPPPTVLRG